MATKHLSRTAPVWAPFGVYALIALVVAIFGGEG